MQHPVDLEGVDVDDPVARLPQREDEVVQMRAERMKCSDKLRN